jgi:hypothetical protein
MKEDRDHQLAERHQYVDARDNDAHKSSPGARVQMRVQVAQDHCNNEHVRRRYYLLG